MERSHQADLLIIGGGVLGTFHAYHALQRGLRVIMLERHAAPRGASVRNFGQIVPSGLDPFWQRFGRESLNIYQSIQSQCDLSVRQNGTIYLASDEEEMTLLDELHAINLQHDYESERWTAEQCRDRYPTLRSSYCRGGLFFPQEISVNPRVLLDRLHQYLGKDPKFSCQFLSSVRELDEDGPRVTALTTDSRSFSATRAILCCGSELQTLFPNTFRESGLEVVKLQMLRLRPQPQIQLPGNILTGLSIRRYESFSHCPSWASIKSRESTDSFWRKWGVHILFKQEADGGIILGDSHEYASVQEQSKLPFDLRQDIHDYFLQEAQKIFDLPRWDVESSWYGRYCQTNDPSGIFTKIIGSKIHVVTGIGGKGMTSSAGFAKHHLENIYDD